MTHPYPTVFSDFDPELIADCNADCHCTPEFMEETSSFGNITLSTGGYFFWFSSVGSKFWKQVVCKNASYVGQKRFLLRDFI